MTASVTSVRAAEMLASVRRSRTDGALRLAYHAALPVVIDSGLLNLLRVNFFLDPPDVLPYEAEAELLLSPLFREIGDDLYEIDPEVRNMLLLGLQSRYGPRRVRQVALLLELYTETTPAWNGQPELEQAQRLTALSFVDPARAEAWLESAHSQGRTAALGREWFVAMRQRLAAQPADADMASEIAAATRQLGYDSMEVRLSAIRTLTALAQLPDCDVEAIVDLLAVFVQRRADMPDVRIHPDVQAAISLIGRLPHDHEADLRHVVLTGADLSDLNLGGATLMGAQLTDCVAARVNLAAADLRGCAMTRVRAPSADLSTADLSNSVLLEVHLRNANLTDADLSDTRLLDVDFGGAVLRGARLWGTQENLSEERVEFAGADLTGAVFVDTDSPPPPPAPPEPDAVVPAAEADPGRLTIDQLSTGQIRRGLVEAIDRDRVIVNLGGVRGQILVSAFSWNQLGDPREVVRVGEPLVVEVIGVDSEGGRVALSLKSTQEGSWQQFASTHQVGQIVPGIVTSLVPFGAFVQVAGGVQGLIHVSELADHPVDQPDEIVQVGDEIYLKIIDIDLDRHRVSLSLQQANESVVGDSDLDFDPTLYGMPATYNAEGNYVYPEGFDPETGQWLPGFEAQRDEWERRYAEAHARYEAHRRQVEAAQAQSQTAEPAAEGQDEPAGEPDQAPLDDLSRLVRSGTKDDLDAAIGRFYEQLSVKRLSGGTRAMLLSHLGVLLRIRFERAGQPADLDEAVEAGEDSIKAAPRRDRNRAGYLSNLSSALLTRYRFGGALADLDQAISVAEDAVAAARSGSDKTSMLSNLSVALKARSERVSSLADLDRAIDVAGQALAAIQPDHADYAVISSNLAIALRARYEWSGDVGDLDRAIYFSEGALAAVGQADPARALLLNNLALALRLRFVRSNTRGDAERAVEAAAAAVAAVTSASPDYPTYLANLSAALLARYSVVGADADVDKAVEAADQAVHAAGPYPEHPDRARAAVMLGNALRVRYEKTGDQSDLSAAITSLRQAADATPSHDRNYAAIQSGLGEALLNRHEGVFSDEDLDESIASFEKALAATAAENPARVRYLSQLASALTERISLTESDEREGSRYQADYGRLAEIEALLGQSAPETRPETAG